MVIESLSLDQLRVMAAVIEHGSFSATAKALGRAQSAITYAIQALEAQLDVRLFDRSAYRPVLSDAGRALLPRIQRVLAEAAILRTEARGIAGGLEPEVSLVVDAMFPVTRLVAALHDFQQRYPTVTTKLFVESLGAATAMVIDDIVDLGILIDFASAGGDLVEFGLAEIELVIVAAPGHALAQAPAPLSHDIVRDQLQLVLSDRSRLTQGRDLGVLAVRTWRLADLGAKHAMLLAGLGWGSMPRHIVADDLAEGRLVELRIDQWENGSGIPRLPVGIFHRRDRPLGPAARWLLGRLAETARQPCPHGGSQP